MRKRRTTRRRQEAKLNVAERSLYFLSQWALECQLECQSHQPPMGPPKPEVVMMAKRRRPVCLEFGPTPRNQPRESDWSTT